MVKRKTIKRSVSVRRSGHGFNVTVRTTDGKSTRIVSKHVGR